MVVVACLLAAGALVPAGGARATTGPTQFLPNSPYRVANKYVPLYRGQYLLKTVARAARLSGAALGVEVNTKGYLAGVGQFYGYDAQGSQTSWTATLYNFHLTSHNRTMVIDLLAPAGRLLLGRLYVQRTNKGDLNGQIQLGRERYTISWHKFSNR